VPVTRVLDPLSIAWIALRTAFWALVELILDPFQEGCGDAIRPPKERPK
jgi:hypothetical protein